MQDQFVIKILVGKNPKEKVKTIQIEWAKEIELTQCKE
tara:strand:+ start:357 stop:470 length:114 start_codon:yes stop_codon:yes gene_type:complete